MIAVEFVKPGTAGTTKEPNPDAVTAIVAHAAANGVLVLSAGTYGNVVRFLPSLAISDALLEDALGVIGDALAAL
jgi:4-aminobutyrate aminotransferase/(S)-3-amino-2-methylpropionate transaminase